MRATRTITRATVVVLALTGCAGDDAEVVDVEEPGGDEASDAGDEPEDGGEGATVIAEDFAFQQDSTLIGPGTRVTWENRDDADHTVTSGPANEPTGVFDQELPANGELTIAFDETGTYVYHCRIHPDMTAELVVEPGVE